MGIAPGIAKLGAELGSLSKKSGREQPPVRFFVCGVAVSASQPATSPFTIWVLWGERGGGLGPGGWIEEADEAGGARRTEQQRAEVL